MTIYSNLETAVRNVCLVANNNYPNMLMNFSHQGGSEPVTSYASINILDMQQMGHHSTPALTNQLKQLDIRVAYEVMVQISFFGTDAGDASHLFTNAVNNNPLVLEAMQQNNLGLMRKSTLRRNPQKRDSQWVDSFNIDLTFSYIINTAQLVDVVEAVIIQDEYSGDVFTVPPDAVTP
tara:strand:- start:64138 stop:64671 length:534 start_codon:yes stop_codon:yes gene_type:complete